ncbi:FAD binding domain containing protein [Hyaloscypha variabilis]
MFIRLFLWILISFPFCVRGFNFPYESIQLTDADVKNYSAIAFGEAPTSQSPTTTTATGECKIYPGDALWPSDAQWQKFNDTLGGALIRGVPPARVCYPGYYNTTQCAAAKQKYFNSQFRSDDPVEIVNEWLDGDSCPPAAYGITVSNASATVVCNEAAYPAYVVNATTVKHIQLAVNFARNSNIRLTIKNTGHDLRGQSAGGESLSIWTHHLKDFEFLTNVTIGDYHGKAARVAAGIQTFDLQGHGWAANVTIIEPGGGSVGAYGGFFQGGGHSTYTSYWGLAANQILSIELVTADGRFVTANTTSNPDLFRALRGGGGGTYGVVTSAITKVYDPVPMGFSSVIFSTAKLSKYVTTVSNTTFWNGIRAYLKFGPKICDAGGIGFSFINHGINGTLTFTSTLSLPGMNYTQANNFSNTMFTEINKSGLNLTNLYALRRRDMSSLLIDAYPSRGAGEKNVRLASRLFPRENFEDDDLLDDTLTAIKNFVVEGGYTFHSVNHCPTLEISGNPDNAVNPAYRTAAMHAQGWDSQPAIGPVEIQKKRYERFNRYFQPWRDVSPDSGSYMGEADPEEPDWQSSFYGENYERLLEIKNRVDPWGLFWAQTAVGSEGWAVRNGGWPTQSGRLCRVSTQDDSKLNGMWLRTKASFARYWNATSL